MKAILIKTDGETTAVNLQEPVWEAIDPLVGGYFEVVRSKALPQNVVMVVNENGHNMNLPYNNIGSSFYPGPIVGDVLLIGEGMTEDGPDFIDITQEQVELIVDTLEKAVTAALRRNKDTMKISLLMEQADMILRTSLMLKCIACDTLDCEIRRAEKMVGI